MNFFDYLNSINSTKKDIMQTDEDEKAYSAFMVNRGLSYFSDTVLLANMMNQRHQLPANMQYDFLRTAVPPKKRFSKWFKADKVSDLEIISEYFNVSMQKAKDYAKVMDPEDINKLYDLLDRGGRATKDKRNG
jgi:hypothetical protein